MIEVRPAQVDDLDAFHRIWWDTDSAPRGRHNPWFAHALATGRMVVAEAAERVVGFAGAREQGTTQVLSDCFVEPGFQGKGVGTAMLGQILDPGRPMMTLASQDPKAQALYRKWGMEPVVDCLYLTCPAAGSPDLHQQFDHQRGNADLDYLVDQVGCRVVSLGAASWAALGPSSVEYSVVAPKDDPVQVFTELFAGLSGPVELEIPVNHLALAQLAGVEFDRDTLMASAGATLPDTWRTTWLGDLLNIPAVW